jgi:hypothetical protein
MAERLATVDQLRPRWTKEQIAEMRQRLAETIEKSSSWTELTRAFANDGITLEGKGQGIVLGDATGTMKLSDLKKDMSPDTELAKMIQPAIGKTDSLFTGKSKFLAEIHELTGAEFADDILTFGEGQHPTRLGKLWTSNDKALHALTKLPQPRIPLIGQQQQQRIGHNGPVQQLQQQRYRKVGAK